MLSSKMYKYQAQCAHKPGTPKKQKGSLNTLRALFFGLFYNISNENIFDYIVLKSYFQNIYFFREKKLCLLIVLKLLIFYVKRYI